jgi:hypothetical protein
MRGNASQGMLDSGVLLTDASAAVELPHDDALDARRLCMIHASRARQGDI